jgi:hypothetical protein
MASTTENSSLTVLRTGGSRSRCELLPSGALRRVCFMPLSKLWVAEAILGVPWLVDLYHLFHRQPDLLCISLLCLYLKCFFPFSYEDVCISLFPFAITKYLGLGNLSRKEVY